MFKPLIRGVLLVVLFYLVISLSHSVYDLWQRRDIVRQRQQKLSQVQAENKHLKEALGDAETPEFIEKQARNKLGLVKPGDVVVIMEDQQAASPPAKVQTTELPSWRAWWKLFF